MECISNTYRGGKFTCRSTHECVCGGLACPFFRCAAVAAEARRRTNGRLNTLPWEQQIYIADKYYGGKMPWKDEVAAWPENISRNTAKSAGMFTTR